MNGPALYAAGTLLVWIGSYLLILAVYRGVIASMRKLGVTSAAVPAVAGALLLAAGLFTTGRLGEVSGAGMRFPIIWIIMPFWGWLSIGLFAAAIWRGVQATFAFNEQEKTSRFQACLILFAGATISLGLLLRDPAKHIEVLRGSIPFSWTTLAILAVLAVASIFAMAAGATRAASASWSRTAISHTALVAGAVVFGLPFAFLLVTSFKEDRDMSSPDGIVWVPKVQQTVPFFNQRNPLYEGSVDGQQVEGTIIERLPDGTVRVDVSKPHSIRGTTFVTEPAKLKEIPRQAPLVTGSSGGRTVKGMVVEDIEDGRKKVRILEPADLKGREEIFTPATLEPVRKPGLRWMNYSEALSFLPPETNSGFLYLRNSLILVVLSVLGTVLSSSLAAYAFSRLKFPGRGFVFGILLATLMLPAAVTLLPQFLIYKKLGWIDTLLPLWVPAFFGSSYNIFLLRQFFLSIPMELEDAAKVDGCSYLRTFWSVLLPQITPALAVVAIWTFMGAWNNFMGPLIYLNSPEKMPLTYALQLFQSDRAGEPGLLMAFATLTMLPVVALFFFAQKYFIEGVTLSGLGGR